MNCNHINGPLYVDNGSILSHVNKDILLDEDISACITVDNDDNRLILHKYGKHEYVKQYYDKVVHRLSDMNCIDLANEWKLISFNVQYPEFNFVPDGHNFTIDEICTLLNWWSNCPGDEGSEIFNLSIDDIKIKLKNLASYGF